MPELPATIPARRPDLLLKPVDDSGRSVVKDLRSGAYFQLGPEESFLFAHLDGVQTPESIRRAFESRFGQDLSLDDVEGFVEDAREQGFLRSDESEPTPAPVEDLDPAGTDEVLRALARWPMPGAPPATPEPPPRRPRLNILFFRHSLFDPDRLFNWLEPRLRFVWTRPFVGLSAAFILAALVTVWFGRQELAAQLPRSVAWQTLALTGVVMIVVTLCHEFAHGLTCKRYGGEVHEVGVLVMYFMPCFYCNVSDAWLIGDKKKRLWITLAGAYCDLILWALGVFTWRVTLPGTWINYTAWIALSVCGVRALVNFNPLIKLDGYYLLTDLTGINNLYQRGRGALMGRLRHMLWGAAPPAPEPRGRLLFWYGLASWLLSLLLVGVFLLGAASFLGARAGYLGLGWTAFLGFMSVRRLFAGIAAGEFKQMVVSRRKRTATWALILAALSFIVSAVPVPDRTGGPFTVRPVRRFELRAPIAGFLREAAIDEGSKVSPGAVLARLQVPDLDSQIERKRAEVRESQSKLRLLEVGPRPEELAEERLRVDRAATWRELARRDLDRATSSLRGELADLDQQIRQYQVELDHAAVIYHRDKVLLARKALQVQELQESEKKWRVFAVQLRQVESRKEARAAEGTLKAEAELARRETELADARAKLRLLEVGTRPEEIEAETAHLARLQEELRYLDAQLPKLALTAPIAGVVVTPRLKEKVGRYYREGDLICEVESLSTLDAEITVPEQDALRVRPGQKVQLKARALPYHSFESTVDRIAPSTVRTPASESPAANNPAAVPVPVTLVIYCRLDGENLGLETGMTGFARIVYGSRPIGAIAWDRALRVLRTEFWW